MDPSNYLSWIVTLPLFELPSRLSPLSLSLLWITNLWKYGSRHPWFPLLQSSWVLSSRDTVISLSVVNSVKYLISSLLYGTVEGRKVGGWRTVTEGNGLTWSPVTRFPGPFISNIPSQGRDVSGRPTLHLLGVWRGKGKETGTVEDKEWKFSTL